MLCVQASCTYYYSTIDITVNCYYISGSIFGSSLTLRYQLIVAAVINVMRRKCLCFIFKSTACGGARFFPSYPLPSSVPPGPRLRVPGVEGPRSRRHQTTKLFVTGRLGGGSGSEEINNYRWRLCRDILSPVVHICLVHIFPRSVRGATTHTSHPVPHHNIYITSFI